MARIIGYKQDEEKPFGIGTLELDDGSEYYVDDPERVRDFLSTVDRESTNIAERGSADRQGEALGTRDRYENATAALAGAPEPNRPFQGIDTGQSLTRRAVAGPGGGEEEPAESLAPTETRAPVLPAAPEPGMSVDPSQRRQPTEDELREAEAANRLARTASLVSPTRPGVNPEAMRRGAVPVEKSFSRKGGMPEGMYAAQAADRATVYDEGNQLVARQYQEDQAVAMQRAEQLRADGLRMKTDNDRQELAIAKKNEKYQADRDYLQKEVDDYYDTSKVDPDRLKKERGVFGNLAVVIAQFMGAYASVMTGSPNFANQILSKKVDNDIDSQIENFKRGKTKRDGQLQRMAERGMSVDQMKAALRLQRELEIQKEVGAAAINEGSREAKQAAQALLMDRKDRFITAENDYRTKALGEETVSGEMVSASGPRAKTPLELAKETADLQYQINRMGHEARGGEFADKAEDRDIRRGEATDKKQQNNEARITAYSARRDAIPDLNKVDSAAERLADIDKSNGGFPGIGRGDISGVAPSWTDRGELTDEVEQLRQTLLNSLISAKPGNKSDADAIRLAKEGLSPDATEAEFRRGIAIAKRYARDQRVEIESSADDETRKAYDERRKKRATERAGASRGEDY